MSPKQLCGPYLLRGGESGGEGNQEGGVHSVQYSNTVYSTQCTAHRVQYSGRRREARRKEEKEEGRQEGGRKEEGMRNPEQKCDSPNAQFAQFAVSCGSVFAFCRLLR